jgi:hypothetical protein
MGREMETTNSRGWKRIESKAAANSDANVSGEHESGQQLQIVSGGNALGSLWLVHTSCERHAPPLSTCPYAGPAVEPHTGGWPGRSGASAWHSLNYMQVGPARPPLLTLFANYTFCWFC